MKKKKENPASMIIRKNIHVYTVHVKKKVAHTVENTTVATALFWALFKGS